MFCFLPFLVNLIVAIDRWAWDVFVLANIYRDLLFCTIVLAGLTIAEALKFLLKIDRRNEEDLSRSVLLLSAFMIVVVVLSSIRYGIGSNDQPNVVRTVSVVSWVFTIVFCAASVVASIILRSCDHEYEIIKKTNENRAEEL